MIFVTYVVTDVRVGIVRKRGKSIPSFLIVICGVKKDFIVVECSRFHVGLVFMSFVAGLCRTIRAIFAHHVSTLMHCSNRPVQGRPGGRCVGRAGCCLPCERGHCWPV